MILAAGGDIDRTTVIEELALTNGGGHFGGGMLVRQNAAPTVRNVAIYGNRAVYEGGGVSVRDGGNLLLEGGQIHDNTARVGGGVNVQDGGVILLQGVQIHDNTARAGAGIGIVHGRATVSDSVIENNQPSVPSDAGALYVAENSQLVMENTVVRGTTASFGGGMRLWLELHGHDHGRSVREQHRH